MIASQQASNAALSGWLERRSFEGNETLEQLLELKQSGVSVVLPAREVATTLGSILTALEPLCAAGLIDELLIVDAASRDGTAAVAAAHGAAVVQESALLAQFGPARGKGDAMWRALSATRNEIVVFLDADTEDFSPRLLLGLLAPLLREPAVQFVKGAYRRPFRDRSGTTSDGGGRVTELLARPLINLHLPELAAFSQPLAGEVAGRRALLESLAFPVGYGVEIAMLIDAHRAVGLEGLAQAQLGSRQNRHQPLEELSAMAYQVLVAAARRIHGSEDIERLAPGELLVPLDGVLRARALPVEERPPLATLREAWRHAAGRAVGSPGSPGHRSPLNYNVPGLVSSPGLA